MARPREFDRDEALEKAINVFWAQGFAATTTDDLRDAMGIGRQSFYNTFGDKRQVYLEALRAYQRRSTSEHLARLTTPESPIAGIRDLLVGVVSEDDARRALGCMGIGSVIEFGTGDGALVEMRAIAGSEFDDRADAHAAKRPACIVFGDDAHQKIANARNR